MELKREGSPHGIDAQMGHTYWGGVRGEGRETERERERERDTEIKTDKMRERVRDC